MGEDDYVGGCFETSDLAKTTTAISSPDTAKAMEYDGSAVPNIRGDKVANADDGPSTQEIHLQTVRKFAWYRGR